ncbi:hypothetical protein ACTZWT_21985 [Rhodopseudomonas sp. NSM]|uniref:hypothetical protein n=1 Tax=Rhodopseudomonas sp. NSM TaxID=3457630 RepID=UPI0040358AC8
MAFFDAAVLEAAAFGVAVFDAAAFEVTAFEGAALDLTAFAVAGFGRADLDNTDVVRDLSFHCIARAPNPGA